MNAILTELWMLASCIHLRESRKRSKGKGRDGIKSSDNLNIRRLQEKDKHTGDGKLAASAYYANFTFADDYGHSDDKVQIADPYQAHNDPVNPGSGAGEEALDCEDDKKYDMFLHILLWMKFSIF